MNAEGNAGKNAGRAMVLGAALLWSTAGAAIKSVGGDGDAGGGGMHLAFQVAGSRSFVAALLMLVLCGREALALNRTAALTALAYAGTVISFVVANRLTTAANAIFIQNSGVLFLLALGPWLLKERNHARDYLAIAALMGGMGLLFLDELSPGQMLGNGVAVFSGFTYALTIMGLRANRQGNPAVPVFYGNVLAAALCLPMFFPLEIGAAKDLALVGYLGIFQLGLSYFLFSRGIRRMAALEATILAFIEPVLNPIWTAIVIGERPGPWALIGCAAIAATLIAHTLAASRANREGAVAEAADTSPA